MGGASTEHGGPGASTVSVPSGKSWGPARRNLLRALVAVNLAAGAWYLSWRVTSSINWVSWFIAVPLLLAEFYSYVDAWLFGLTMWRVRRRPPPGPAPEHATVDVLITCYNEPASLVRATVRRARAIRYPHRTYVLDDGNSPDIEEMARAEQVGYIRRGEDWQGKPRHAKAGNLNNALFETSGEFLLVLDADQLASPEILDRTLGYFNEPDVALVQTTQFFYNVPRADPLGSQAPLFYGPIQQGKDGWNAAFFCGSNAVLRREALMQLGVVGYVREVRAAILTVLRTGDRIVARARRHAGRDAAPAAREALDGLEAALRQARADLAQGMAAQEVTGRFQHQVRRLSRQLVSWDVAQIQAELADVPIEADREGGLVIDDAALAALAERDWSPLGALGGVGAMIRALDVDRSQEAMAVMPLATISVTEDMATAMRLHGLGWRSVYADEVLAYGLAPEDLGASLQQRLRWAQGTLQVLLKENPLVQRGLTIGQKLMYLSTMWSYLSGFAAVVYLSAPMLFLFFGVYPIKAFSPEFFLHIGPYLVANQLAFLVAGWGYRVWRGHQYNLALFPLWIHATWTAVVNVVLGRPLGFVVTPKLPGGRARARLVWPQLLAIGLLLAAAGVGAVRYVLGLVPDVVALAVNFGWVAYDLLSLTVVIGALRYRGPDTDLPQPFADDLVAGS